jgi:c-di-AMP phosphodiesterase-like protein
MAGDEPIVCYIIVDNLSEMMQYDSEQYKPAAVKIDEVIRAWADEYGGILKEYERDKYLFITEARALSRMIQGKFDILDRVRSVGVGDSALPLTISMGVSNISGTFEEKEKVILSAAYVIGTENASKITANITALRRLNFIQNPPSPLLYQL